MIEKSSDHETQRFGKIYKGNYRYQSGLSDDGKNDWKKERMKTEGER